MPLAAGGLAKIISSGMPGDNLRISSGGVSVTLASRRLPLMAGASNVSGSSSWLAAFSWRYGSWRRGGVAISGERGGNVSAAYGGEEASSHAASSAPA